MKLEFFLKQVFFVANNQVRIKEHDSAHKFNFYSYYIDYYCIIYSYGQTDGIRLWVRKEKSEEWE